MSQSVFEDGGMEDGGVGWVREGGGEGGWWSALAPSAPEEEET
jgi:hypothetical protein